MTNPTLERAARALFDSYMSLAYTKADAEFPTPDVVEEIWQEGRDGFIQSARAVLFAVREPDGKMLKAGFAAMNATPSGTWKRMKAEARHPIQIFNAKMRPRWSAMIDAILADGKGE